MLVGKNILLTVKKEDVSQRLDLYVVLQNNSISRTQLKKLINEGKVKINGIVEFRPHYKVRENDVINIEVLINNISQQRIIPQDIDLNIIYEDKDLLVVNKPEGMVIHPAQGNYTDTLMNAVVFKYQQLENVGDNIRSGLIHRIDKDTSGIVLIGKTNKGLWYYSKLFANREIEKTYLAIVAGNIKPKIPSDGLEIANYLGRNPKNRKKFGLLTPENGGKYALTHLKYLKTIILEDKICTAIIAKPKTGRTHQIRVHLSNMGYPIMGDTVYGRNNNYSRLLLHAWKIKLPLIDGTNKVFTADIPKEFNIVL
jgi:23S rRNA pseudouridine1911/1915/1917 synthase